MRELGRELKERRTVAGLTLRDLAGRLGAGFSNPRLSQWETGRRLPPLADLVRVLDELGTPADVRERILGLRRDADDAPGQLTAGATTLGGSLTQLVKHEAAASRIVDVAPLLVPGLLQTSDYARAIMGDVPDADTRVALRAGRREILTRRSPVEFLALVDTEALVRPIAPRDVMVEQMHHLLTMARRPNVTIQLISSTRPGFHPGLAGPFELIGFPKARPIVLLEHHRSSLFLWEERDVAAFLEASEEIRQAAMTPAESTGIIENIVHGMETT